MKPEALKTVEDADYEGLICAFRLSPIAPVGREVLAQTTPPAPLWLHLNTTDTRARRYIEQRAELPEDAVALLVGANPRIQVQVGAPVDGQGPTVLAILGDLHHDASMDVENFGFIHVYVDGKRMISARRHPLQSPDRLRRELSAQPTNSDDAEPAETPYALFEHLLRVLGETFAQTVARLAEETEDAEDLILAGEYKDQRGVLGRIRRVLVRVRRQVSANRAALGILPTRLAAVLGPDLTQRLRAAIDRFEAIAQDIEVVQERARLLQEEIAGQVSESTNRNLFWLSIMTTTLLPITLITGVFGMNVGGLPFLTDHNGFWWVVSIMMTSVLAILLLLRRRKVL